MSWRPARGTRSFGPLRPVVSEHRAIRRVDVPTVLLAIAAVVLFVLGMRIDGVVLGAVVVLVAVDRRLPPAVGGEGVPDRSWRPVEPSWLGRRRVVVVAGAAVVYAVGFGLPRAYTLPSYVGVLLPAAVVPIAWWTGREQRGAERAPLPSGSVWWAVVFLVLCAWDVIAFSFQPAPDVNSYDHPTLSALAEHLVTNPVGRVVTIVAWLALGAWVVTR